MKFFKGLFLLAIILTSGCPNHDIKYIPEVKDTEFCQAAEENLINSCPRYVKPNRTMRENNETFKDFCKRKQDDGIFFNPKCLSTAKTCQEADSCNDPRNAQ